MKLVQAKISPKTIGGPILIAQMAGEVAQRGIDGSALVHGAPVHQPGDPQSPADSRFWTAGTCSFRLIEWLRGKPVSLRKREIAQQVGMVLLVGLMVFAFYNDIFRWLGQP